MWRTAFCIAMAPMPMPAFAHHSLAEFDRSRRTTLEGIISEFAWTNPHTWIHLTARDPSTRQEQTWQVEGPGPGILQSAGWTSASLKSGDRATVVFYPARDPASRTGLLVNITVGGQTVWRNPFESSVSP
jgi:hypothetical protein